MCFQKEAKENDHLSKILEEENLAIQTQLEEISNDHHTIRKKYDKSKDELSLAHKEMGLALSEVETLQEHAKSMGGQLEEYEENTSKLVLEKEIIEGKLRANEEDMQARIAEIEAERLRQESLASEKHSEVAEMQEKLD